MRKYINSVFLFGVLLLLVGCSSKNQNEVHIHEEGQSAGGDKSFLEENTVIKSWPEDRHAASILEDAEAVYFCGKNNILKFYKETGETEYIWESTKGNERGGAYEYSGVRGILAKEQLYFIEEWSESEAKPMWAFSVVGTDGSGYEQIECFASEPSVREGRLNLLDGVLYYAFGMEDKRMEGYPLDENGVLITEEKVVTKAENVPVDYWETYYYENGNRELSAQESQKRFGYYLLYDEAFELCIVDLESGIKRELPKEVAAYNLVAVSDEYFLLGSYTDEKLILMDVRTLEVRNLTGYDPDCNVISLDKDYVYIQKVLKGDDYTQYQYQRIALTTGVCEELFTVDAFVGMEADSPWFLMDISVLNDYIYYVGAQDYKLYLMRRALDMPAAEETIGEAFYDTRISEVGIIQTYNETVYSMKDPDKVVGKIGLEQLVVAEHYQGADKINALLEEEQPGFISYIHENAEQYDAADEFDMPVISFYSEVSPIYYMDERYFSFVQENYEYSGGAHGMPFWIGHTFDLMSGQELLLSDIIADEEEALKEIVLRYFIPLYQQEPDAYWEDAQEIVKESTSLQSSFYLNEEGIVFYYGPYELAPYAGGFKEVTVPFSEFDLKIELQKGLGEDT